MKRERMTRDRFTNKKLAAALVEVLGKNGKWYRLGEPNSGYEKNPPRDVTRGRREAAVNREAVKRAEKLVDRVDENTPDWLKQAAEQQLNRAKQRRGW